MLFIKKLIATGSTRPLVIGLGATVLLLQALALTASAEPSAEATLNQIFGSDVPLPGANSQERQNRIAVKTVLTQWMGGFQGVRKENDNYRVLFEQGSALMNVQFRKNGDPDTLGIVGCPVTSVPVSQAPRPFQKRLLDSCPDLKP
jgi:hypothetical protein